MNSIAWLTMRSWDLLEHLWFWFFDIYPAWSVLVLLWITSEASTCLTSCRYLPARSLVTILPPCDQLFVAAFIKDFDRHLLKSLLMKTQTHFTHWMKLCRQKKGHLSSVFWCETKRSLTSFCVLQACVKHEALTLWLTHHINHYFSTNVFSFSHRVFEMQQFTVLLFREKDTDSAHRPVFLRLSCTIGAIHSK